MFCCRPHLLRRLAANCTADPVSTEVTLQIQRSGHGKPLKNSEQQLVLDSGRLRFSFWVCLDAWFFFLKFPSPEDSHIFYKFLLSARPPILLAALGIEPGTSRMQSTLPLGCSPSPSIQPRSPHPLSRSCNIATVLSAWLPEQPAAGAR